MWTAARAPDGSSCPTAGGRGAERPGAAAGRTRRWGVRRGGWRDPHRDYDRRAGGADLAPVAAYCRGGGHPGLRVALAVGPPVLALRRAGPAGPRYLGIAGRPGD